MTTLIWFLDFSLLGSSLELKYMLNEELFLLSPSVFSSSGNSMWHVFVPMNPAWGRWKGVFLKKSR